MLIYVVLWLVNRYRRPSLVDMLEPYRLNADDGGVAGARPVSPCPLLTRLAGRRADPGYRDPLGPWLDGMLERAGSRIRVGELLTIWATAGVILILLGWLLAGLVGLLIVLILSIVIPLAVLKRWSTGGPSCSPPSYRTC